MAKRVLSGMRPTGKLHLGHWSGALSNYLKFQAEYDCFYVIVDYHALTSEYANSRAVRSWSLEILKDWLAAGIDPNRSTLFVQSHVPQHAELHLLLSMIVPLPWLERVPTYKEMKQQLQDRDLNTYGFLGYPLLQTADIILYKAELVPVGEDQLPHLELAREITRRFNTFYGDVFPEPKAVLTPVPRIPGTDGRKMSKSLKNAVFLDDPLDLAWKKKIATMVTDPARIRRKDPGDPNKCPVFDLHKAYSSNEEQSWAAQGCRTASIGCLDCKKVLFKNIQTILEPFQERRRYWDKHEDELHDILAEGARRAKEVAKQTLAEAWDAVGILSPP